MHYRLFVMGALSPWVCLAALLGIVSVIAGGCMTNEQAPPNSKDQALAEFKERTDDYATLQKTLADRLGPLDETKSPAEISTRERGLGEAIQAERAGAKEGDMFSPAVATLFRAIIREEFAHRSRLALEDRDEAQDELPNFTPTVNQIYPTTYPLATFPPGVLGHLPELPEPLEYRFVQRNLILRDVEANVIVDVLRGAAPSMSELARPLDSAH